jgi:hypothetical protein
VQDRSALGYGKIDSPIKIKGQKIFKPVRSRDSPSLENNAGSRLSKKKNDNLNKEEFEKWDTDEEGNMNQTQLALNQFSKRFDGDMDALITHVPNDEVFAPQKTPKLKSK